MNVCFYVKTNCMHHTHAHTTDEISNFLIVIILIIECRQCRFILHVGTSLNFICRSKHFLKSLLRHLFTYLPTFMHNALEDDKTEC